MSTEELEHIRKQLLIWLQNPVIKDLMGSGGLKYIHRLESIEDANGTSYCTDCGMQVKTIREIRAAFWEISRLCNPRQEGNSVRPGVEIVTDTEKTTENKEDIVQLDG